MLVINNPKMALDLSQIAGNEGESVGIRKKYVQYWIFFNFISDEKLCSTTMSQKQVVQRHDFG
jgi:hypothetical protein